MTTLLHCIAFGASIGVSAALVFLATIQLEEWLRKWRNRK